MAKQANDTADRPVDDDYAQRSPAAWFVQLEICIRKNDFAGAARAQEHLKRLGVNVKLDRKRLLPDG